MEKVNISNDLSITNICFGTSALGNMPETYGYEVDPSEAEETIHVKLSNLLNAQFFAAALPP